MFMPMAYGQCDYGQPSSRVCFPIVLSSHNHRERCIYPTRNCTITSSEVETAMRMLIQYQNGLRVEAVLLAANSERMRVAIESQCDTIELEKANGRWYPETGPAIEIEALIPIDGTDFSCFCSEVYPRTAVAGRAF